MLSKNTKRNFKAGAVSRAVRITQSAGGVVLNKLGQVLVISQHGTTWSLPKGHVERGENTLEAAKREILEEAGVSDLTLVKKLGWYERYRIGLKKDDDKSEKKRIHMFLFRTKTRKLKPVHNKHPDVIWADKKNVASILTHRKDKLFFEKAMRRERGFA
jgi:8-oxo-dGTP pyrophosphatase MutT (NUDIX family)